MKFTHTHSIWHQYDVIDMLIKLVIVTQLQHLNTTNDCNKLNNNSITIEITIWCNINAMITSTKLTQNSLRYNWILQPSLVLAIKTRWEKHSTNYKCHSYIVWYHLTTWHMMYLWTFCFQFIDCIICMRYMLLRHIIDCKHANISIHLL